MKQVIAVPVAVIVILMTIWVTGALYYSPILYKDFRPVAASIFILATLFAFVFLPRRRWTFFGFFSVFFLLIVIYFNVPASNARNWQTEVAVTPYASMRDDLVTIHGVRNFDYHTETDFKAHWETRTYDLRDLDSLDLIASYWSNNAIAHIMLSFGFKEEDYLSFSIETRKEKGEDYSTFAGFFRQYELVYVVADERDVIRVRANYREPQEDVYAFRLQVPKKNIRRVFIEYIEAINELRDQPRFYNTLTTNCTTGVFIHTKVNPESPPFSWKILLSGFLPKYLYELGKIGGLESFEELKILSYINERAHEADDDEQYSKIIRDASGIVSKVD